MTTTHGPCSSRILQDLQLNVQKSACRVIGGDPDARGLSWEPEVKELELLDGDKLLALGSGQAFGHHDDLVVLDKAMHVAYKTNLSPVQK